MFPTQILAIDPCFYFGDLSKGTLAGPLPVEDDIAYVPAPVDTSNIQLPRFDPLPWRFPCSHSSPQLCGEHPGQAGWEYPRDVGNGEDRGRLDFWRTTRRHDGASPMSHPVPKSSSGVLIIMLISPQINALELQSDLWKVKMILFLNTGREALQRATSASNIEDNHCSGISGIIFHLSDLERFPLAKN